MELENTGVLTNREPRNKCVSPDFLHTERNPQPLGDNVASGRPGNGRSVPETSPDAEWQIMIQSTSQDTTEAMKKQWTELVQN